MFVTPKLGHDVLARSLADHLRSSDRMVWCDMQLGPTGSPRPDVYTIFKSFVRPTPMAYECKVSVSDFRADVTAGKWQSYLQYAAGVTFACEAGLILKADIPEHCGLIVLTGDTWRMAKKPILRAVTIPQDAMLKLLIDGVEREGPRYRALGWSESAATATYKQRFGEVAARVVKDRLEVEREVEDRQRQANRLIESARQDCARLREEATEAFAPQRRELCGVLGLQPNADKWQIERAVSDIRRALREHPAIGELRALTAGLQRALDHHGFKEPKSAEAQAS